MNTLDVQRQPGEAKIDINLARRSVAEACLNTMQIDTERQVRDPCETKINKVGATGNFSVNYITAYFCCPNG